MGFFDHLFHNRSNNAGVSITCEPKTVYSPLKGTVVELNTVKDTTFASGMLGQGVGIIPDQGLLYAPVCGTVAAAFPTGHAIGMKTADGMELLIHIGIDTVELNGKYFHLKVKEGDQVKAGDLLIEFEPEPMKKEGYDVTTMLIVSNYAALGTMETPVTGPVAALDRLFAFHK